MKKILFTGLLCLLSGIVQADQIACFWDFGKPGLCSDPRQFVPARSEKNNFSFKLSQERTPAGERVLEITPLTSESKVHHAKQVNFAYGKPLKKGELYKLEFYIKGSVPGVVTMTAAQSRPPYKGVGNSWKQINVTKNWQKVEKEFTISGDFNPPNAIPRFMFGSYPVNQKLQLGSVKLIRMDKIAELKLSKQWKMVLKNAPVNHIPADAQSVELKENSIDLASHFKGTPKQPAVFYNLIQSENDCRMAIGISADWYFECFINGKKVYDTLKNGNLSNLFIPSDHIFRIPVKKGNNLLAIRVLSGSAGWRFVCGKVDPALKESPVFEIKEGRGWKQIENGRIHGIKKGTALDFSELNGKRETAGNSGKVLLSPQGKFVFEKKPDEPIRFYAFNFNIGNWRQKVHEWSKKDIDNFAEKCALQGYNMLRLHFLDGFLVGFRRHVKRDRTLANTALGQTPEELPVNPADLDRFDYLVYALKKQGIYLNVDIMTQGVGYTLAYPYAGSEGRSVRTHLYFDPVYRNHWEAACAFLLNHVNKYTGTALKDEPAVVMINFLNEQENSMTPYSKQGMAFYTPHFRKWLKKKYVTDAALADSWGRNGLTFETVPPMVQEQLFSKNKDGADARAFLRDIQTEMTDWYIATARKHGWQGMTQQWDMIARMQEMPNRAKTPVIAQHTYFSHPYMTPAPRKVKLTNTRNLAGNGKLINLIPRSSIGSGYFRSAAAIRFLDRPYVITEYSHSAPQALRHERGLYFGAYAALQDWDSLAAHADMVMRQADPIGIFEGAGDPIARASEAVAALTFLRRDVSSAKNMLAVKLDEEMLKERNFEVLDDNLSQLAMVSRFGILLPGISPHYPVGKVVPDAFFPPEFEILRWGQWYQVPAKRQNNRKFNNMIASLKDKGLLDKNNRSNGRKQVYESDTGELFADTSAGTLSVKTPRLEGAVLKKNIPVKLDKVSIARCTVPASVVLASLDRGKSLEYSKRLLLVISTNALNNGTIFTNSMMNGCLSLGDWGKVIMQTVEVDLSLRTRQNSPQVFALALDGTRMEKIPAEVKDGVCILKINTEKLKHATPFFEIIFP